MNGWCDIATAPKDGTEFLAYGPAGYGNWAPEFFISWWVPEGMANDAQWRGPHDMEGHVGYPSHWMPLPEPPEVER